MRLGSIRCGKGAVDDWLDLPIFQQWPDMRAQRAGNRRFEGHRARAQGGTGDGQALAQYQGGIQAGLHATLDQNQLITISYKKQRGV